MLKPQQIDYNEKEDKNLINKRILVINGSARVNGNTDIILSRLITSALQTDVQIKQIDVRKKKIKDKDTFWMKRAITLAKRARGDVNHYPMVGAVIVKNGKKISEGYFRRPGEPHAEVHALRRAGKKAKGADIYVNLEPCSHLGTTPPCADAVIKAGMKRVVTGMTDPNPLVAGKGRSRPRRPLTAPEGSANSQAAKG